RRAADVAGAVRGEKAYGLGDFLRARMAAERDLLVEPFARIPAEELAHGLLRRAHEDIVDRARIDAVDADAASSDLLWHAAHQAHQGMFGCDIRAIARHAFDADNTRSDHDAAAVVHLRNRVFAGEKATAHVGRNDFVEQIFGIFGDRHQWTIIAGVGEQNV